jgi:hypothetical protein
MKYAVERGSGAMIYIPSFDKDWFRLSKVDGGGGIHRHIDSMEISQLSLFF